MITYGLEYKEKIMELVLIIFGIIILLIILFFLILLINHMQPFVKENYYDDIDSLKKLEKKYSLLGSHEVSYVEYKSCDREIKKFEIWYPKDLLEKNKKYPLIVMANGTGVPAKRYKAIFHHLASWGFVVIGNEDNMSWEGRTSSISLDYMLKLNKDESSIFYRKIDTKKVGISGHSQGGIAAINALNYENGKYYQSLYTASCPVSRLSDVLKWRYDIKLIHIPYFMTAGTGRVDAKIIAPFVSLESVFRKIENGKLTVMARRKGSGHKNMVPQADSYMTAWFLYTLMSDQEAEKVFGGENPEILENTTNWQDVKIKNAEGRKE